MFKNSKEIMRKIKNKEDLSKPEYMTLERCLRLYDCCDKMLNYQVDIDEDNFFELTMKNGDKYN